MIDIEEVTPVQLKLFISPTERKQFVEIHSPQMDKSVQKIIQTVEDIDRLTEINGKVFNTKYRLYELEEQLPNTFIRISKSEIVNQHAIIKLQLEANGLIRMYLKNLDDDYTYSSRRYLKSIKERLSL
ncbi:LytTR family DNA-binding domain-containing protein [Staphylococcus warneri]|jgi:DNA-binding LytR/AlgR family response regulator|uniref:LytTR family DNA-binding domain-containing protein n=1 Tax=Staphylococcus warneri TaxID=1292 RepID=UPI001E60D813|nr:LytTR family transcriptional regulator DNA-binding domain-containing protein [Staphylococcus warneri]